MRSHLNTKLAKTYSKRHTSTTTPKNDPTSKEIIQKLTAYEPSTSNLFPKTKESLIYLNFQDPDGNATFFQKPI